jgi:hypothetical protein
MGAVATGAILFAVLLGVAAAMVWQSKRVGSRERAVYVVDEAVSFVNGGLPDDTASRIGGDDVRSMLEWSVYHSQVVAARSGEEVPVIGGPAAVEYVCARAAEQGRSYAEEDVRMVLDLEAAYLVSIGAIGEMVAEEAP